MNDNATEPNEEHEAEVIDVDGIGPPVAVSTACKIEQATAIIRCESCGTRARLNLLSAEVSACPGCEVCFSSALLITEPHDVEAIADLIATIDGDDDDDQAPDQGGADDDEIQDAQPARQQNPEPEPPIVPPVPPVDPTPAK